MVFTVPVREGWTRRSVLWAGAVVAGAVAGCTRGQRSPEPEPDPLEPLLATARRLASQCRATIARHPELTELLRPLEEAHVAHAEALRSVIHRMPATAAAEPTPSPVPVPPEPEQAIEELRAAEQAAQEAATQACLSAPAGRAALLGSITAALASHLAVLP